MSISTISIDVEQLPDGTYLTLYLPDGSYSKMGPLTTGQMIGRVCPPAVGTKKVNAKARRRRSIQQENEIAVRQGANRVKGSGAVSGNKGDVRKPGTYRFEAKYTDKKSFRLEHADLAKIRSECTNLEAPCFEIHFLDPSTQRAYDRWVVVDARYFQHMEYKPPYAATFDK